MQGSRPNEVEVNEERSSRAGGGMQKGTREYIQNGKRKEPRKGGTRTSKWGDPVASGGHFRRCCCHIANGGSSPSLCMGFMTA